VSNVTYGIIKGILLGLIIFCFQLMKVLPSHFWFNDLVIDVVGAIFVCITGAVLSRKEPDDDKQQ